MPCPARPYRKEPAVTASRKDDHVRLALAQTPSTSASARAVPNGSPSPFDDVHLIHHALAGTDRTLIDLSSSFAGMHWPVPLYINAMTGGSPMTGEINRDLAIAGHETGLPVATGSMSPYLKDPDTADTFATVRRHHPHGFIMANVNALATPEQARRAVGLLEANALQIHINAVQETVMPEGDRSFGSWPASIEAIATAVAVPVIVKEVGFGLSGITVSQLADLGVAVADVAGGGGTNFAAIENGRREQADYSYLNSWGLSTPAALLDARGCGLPLLASGGIRHPLDVVRSLALGAHAAGVSAAFLATLQRDGLAPLISQIQQWLDQITALMTVLGAHCPAEVSSCDVVLTGSLYDFARQRCLDIKTSTEETA
ncbi:type 2 isopentenyl-diphosphate Delta-isomerase [Streptomyces cyaneofuscatus]|uniref:type 2 isopentenyl-diphosphate Delta-isomerase n=1 Tax=Streptomyces cyaneofuscatus TaxID=66883 RepID=UPI003652E76F